MTILGVEVPAMFEGEPIVVTHRVSNTNYAPEEFFVILPQRGMGYAGATLEGAFAEAADKILHPPKWDGTPEGEEFLGDDVW